MWLPPRVRKVILQRLFLLDEDLLAIGGADVFGRVRGYERDGTGCACLRIVFRRLAVFCVELRLAISDVVDHACGVRMRFIVNAWLA